jgi:UDP-glucose 4-epimerase
MKILCTGSAGFVGSHLKTHLESQGHTVTGYDLATGQDLLNKKMLDETFEQGRFDEVYHVAAQAFMRAGEDNPEMDVRINCLGMHYVLANALKHGCRVLYTSSGAVYGVTPDVPQREDSPPMPVSNYGCSKLFGEFLLRKYVESSGLDAVYTRFSSVYGPNRKDGPVNIFIRRALEGKPIVVNGDGSHTRDYVHVSDAVKGLSLVMARGKAGECYNVASGVETSVRQIADEVKANIPSANITYNTGYEYDRFDIPRSYFSVEKARALGFSPVVRLREGVTRTIEGWV